MEEIVEIKNGNYLAKINLSRGANCICLRERSKGAKILREPDYEKGIDNPYLYGMPILYPANRIEGGTFSFQEREYVFPINEKETSCHLHGKIHACPFSLVEKTENSVKCRMEEKERAGFPHTFRIEITYRLSDEGLFQKTEIFNLSHQDMPNFLAFHTTFNLPFLEGADPEKISVLAEVGEEIQRNMKNYLPTGKILPSDEITEKFCSGSFYPFGKTLSRHYKKKATGRLEILDHEKRVKIVYENSENFPFRLIYTGDGKEYVCLEPMTNMANCQRSPFDRGFAGFDFIPPHSSKIYISKIRLEEF